MAVSGRPKIAESPLELLNSPGIEPGVINTYYVPVITGLMGFGAVVIGNWATKRPFLSGFQKHIASGVLGAAIGWYYDERRNRKLATRDAIYRHYIELHPEEFPPYERKQFKNLLEPWIPVR